MDDRPRKFVMKFRKSYGWAKTKPDYDRCAAWESWNYRQDGNMQCSHPNGYGPEKAYCYWHGVKMARGLLRNLINEIFRCRLMSNEEICKAISASVGREIVHIDSLKRLDEMRKAYAAILAARRDAVDHRRSLG